MKSNVTAKASHVVDVVPRSDVITVITIREYDLFIRPMNFSSPGTSSVCFHDLPCLLPVVISLSIESLPFVSGWDLICDPLNRDRE